MINTPSYFVASYPGKPGYFAAVADKPESARQNQEAISAWKRQGALVTRVSASDAMAGLDLYLDECRPSQQSSSLAVSSL